jgi:hypothetical protein
MTWTISIDGQSEWQKRPIMQSLRLWKVAGLVGDKVQEAKGLAAGDAAANST